MRKNKFVPSMKQFDIKRNSYDHRDRFKEVSNVRETGQKLKGSNLKNNE